MAVSDDFALDTVSGLAAAIGKSDAVRGDGATVGISLRTFVAGYLYCGRCGGHRRIRIESDSKFDTVSMSYLHFGARFKVSIYSTPAPALFRYVCTQCDGTWSVLLYPSAGNLSMAALPAHLDGSSISTPNTPGGIAYYLSQAALCHYIGANSAAVTMFRSAAEWLLEDQGFKAKMLGPKLAELDAALASSTAPKWAYENRPRILENDQESRESGNAHKFWRPKQAGCTRCAAIPSTRIDLSRTSRPDIRAAGSARDSSG